VKGGIFGLNSVILGGLAAGLSVVIVLGSMLLAFTEAGGSQTIESFPTLESVDTITSPPPTPPPAIPSAIPPTITPTMTAPPTLTPTTVMMAAEEQEQCDKPDGWLPHTITSADTLNQLAEAAGLTPQELADANCLQESRLILDTIIYLPPPPPTEAPPPASCGPPSNWVVYIVQRGDTLFSIAQRVNSTVQQLKNANCLTSNTIRTGQKLYVPYRPAPLPPPPTALPTQPPPTPSPTEIPPTETPPSATPTDVPTTQPPPSDTPTEVPPAQQPPSATPTEVTPSQPSPSATNTPES
jgi:LysM repeat protein